MSKDTIKIIVSQSGDSVFTVGGGMLFNLGDVDGKFSVGVNNFSLGLYTLKKSALKELENITAFLCGDAPRHQLGADK